MFSLIVFLPWTLVIDARVALGSPVPALLPALLRPAAMSAAREGVEVADTGRGVARTTVDIVGVPALLDVGIRTADGLSLGRPSTAGASFRCAAAAVHSSRAIEANTAWAQRRIGGR